MSTKQTFFLNSDNKKKIGKLLIISILIISCSISFLIRVLPADYGWQLHEFDPFFNFRATEFIIENGLNEYYNWHDELSWYPNGRNISANSQNFLHIFTAFSYMIFGGGIELHDYVILFPAIIGSLSCITIFGLGRVIGGTTAGLFSSLLFSISIPILVRGQLGWFKSEPLGIFLSTLSVYLFLSGIYSSNKKIILFKMISGGLIFTAALSSWGGNFYFLLILGFFILSLILIKKPISSIWSIPTFVISTIFATLFVERLSTNFIFGLSGLSLIIPTIFFLISGLFEHKFKNKNTKKIIKLFFIFFIIISASIFTINYIHKNLYGEPLLFPIGSYRYLNVLNPFLTTSNSLIESISEHAITNIASSFLFHSTFLIFASLGIWFMLSKNKFKPEIKNDKIIFLLILGFFGAYIGSAFMRLEVFTSISLIILSSISLSIILKILTNKKNFIYKIIFFLGIISFLVIPLILPYNSIYSISHIPPTIVNGGTQFPVSSDDWVLALDWLKNNSEENSKIISWWDYGYWIETNAQRVTYVDNATLYGGIIEKIAKIFFSEPIEAWTTLTEMNADYVVIFVAAEKIPITDSEGNSLYVLRGGGDESKLYWISRIGNVEPPQFFHPDGVSPTTYFWDNTFIGKAIPFSSYGYLNPNDASVGSKNYVNGYVQIFTKDVKFNESSALPFNLVYSSPSFDHPVNDEYIIGIFIYKVNENFIP